MRKFRAPALRAATWWAAGAALLFTGGVAGWRLRQTARLSQNSEAFQCSPSHAGASLLIVGDSTAVGTGASASTQSVAGLIAQAHPAVRIVNLAADGAKYEDFAVQLLAAEGRFDTVLVLGGGNDVIRLTRRHRLRASVIKVAALARERGARVIMMPPGNVGNAPFFLPPLSWWMTRRSRTLHDAVREAAAQTGAAYVDLYHTSRDDPFAQRPREMHAKDGLHPSDAGYRVWLAELNQQAKLDVLLGI